MAVGRRSLLLNKSGTRRCGYSHDENYNFSRLIENVDYIYFTYCAGVHFKSSDREGIRMKPLWTVAAVSLKGCLFMIWIDLCRVPVRSVSTEQPALSDCAFVIIYYNDLMSPGHARFNERIFSPAAFFLEEIGLQRLIDLSRAWIIWLPLNTTQ